MSRLPKTATSWPIKAFTLFTLFAAGPIQALPSPWQETDIGSVGVAGSSLEANGLWSVYGSGADIWGNADGFHYVYQRLNGNTQIVAKVSSIANTNGWAKAGVMIREDLTPGSRHAFVTLSPSNGVAFQSRSNPGGTSTNVNVTGFAPPYWVKLARSGDKFTAYRSADGVTWTLVGTTRLIGMQPVVYVGLAATSHDNARLGFAVFTQVSLLAPPALFVVGSTTLNAGDAAAKKRLESLGYAVTVKAAASAVSADANGKDLVVVSSTVTATAVGNKFTNTAVPVITWENAILDDLGMTGAVSGTDFGTSGAQTDANIFSSACDRATAYTAAKAFGDGCHDITAGLTGQVPVLRAAQALSWGKPGAAAVKIAHEAGNANHAVVFAYEKGAAMPRLASAPERRVALFLGDNSAAAWTGRGQGLFDNAVYWATHTRYFITKKVLVLVFDPVLRDFGNRRLSDYGFTHYTFFGDPRRLIREYLMDLTEASGGYVRWKEARYANIPDYIDRWVPITSPVQFATPQFTEQDYFTGYNLGYFQGQWIEAGQAMPDSGRYSSDYNRILDEYAVDAKVNAGEVDEVVLASYPFAGMNESFMAGSTAYPVNGPAIFRNAPNYIVMGPSYERRLGEALENFNHRTEWLVSRAFFGFQETIPYHPCYWPDFPAGPDGPCPDGRMPTPQRNIYDRFSAVDGILPGNAGVGASHWAPNVLFRFQEYLWHLDNSVYSMADDWQFNYPNLVGAATKRLVNVEVWRPMATDGDAGRAYKKWYHHHMPRIPGHYVDPGNAQNHGKLNNWWEYIVNFNRHPESR